MSTPAPNVRSYSHGEARRSERVERMIPLLIMGTDKLGRSFHEESSAVCLNLHGCRYSTRHEYPIGSRVTLKVARAEGRDSTRVVRARVCTTFPPELPGQLCQVGVEFEIPGNVLGIDAVPNDWQRRLEGVPATAGSAAAIAPSLEPAGIPLPHAPLASEGRHFDVAKFPELTPKQTMPDQPKGIASGRPEPVVTRADELVAALQRKLHLAADTAVEKAIATHLDDAVRAALERIEEASRASAPQVAWIDEPKGARDEELDSCRAHAEEIAERLELLIGNARKSLADMQSFLGDAANQVEPQINSQLRESIGRAAEELENTAARVAEREFENFSMGTQAVLQEALLQMDTRVAVVRPLLEKTLNSPPLEHMEAMLHATKEEILGFVGARMQEMRSQWEEQRELQRIRLDELAEKFEKLAGRPVLDMDNTRKLALQAVRELEPQVNARLEESVGRAAKNFETAAASVSDRQLVRLMDEKQRFAHEASLEIQSGTAKAQAQLLKTANITLEEFRRQLEVQIDLAISEATQRMTSSLGSLDAENRAACDARRRSLEGDIARAAEQSTQEFRSGMKAFLYSCLVAAVSAVDEHAQTTLKGLDKNAVSLPEDLMPFPGTSGKGKNDSSGDDNSR